MFSPLFRDSRKQIVLGACAIILIVALIDWRAINELPLGFVYLLPMLMLGRVLPPVPIACAAFICTILTEIFDEYVWTLKTGLPRDVLYFSAFFCAGLFIYEINKSRRLIMEHMHEIEQQSDARRDAEEQLKLVIESSPAAIITADSDGHILMANEAAHRMLLLQPDALQGQLIHSYFPSLVNISQQQTMQRFFRTVMQARGQRSDGEIFQAEICFSTYRTDGTTRLATMILDTSEEFRTREEASLHQMLSGSRIAAAAISHEVRNVSGAISVVHQNLTRNGLFAKNKDFEALGQLLHTLERIAAVDLRQYGDQTTETDLIAVLEDVKIILEPSLKEEGIITVWDIPSYLPIVWADRQNLMQVFLNLISNSIRALSDKENKMLSIVAKISGRSVLVELTDNAGGVAFPDQLFHPFQPEAQLTGLGLFLSRAFMRSCKGDLRYKPVPGGACFVVEMPTIEQPKNFI